VTCVTRGFDSFSMSGWYPATTNGTNADLLQVLLGQVREDPLVDLVVAERSLILSKAKAPQPDHDVHDGARASPWSISSSERPGEVLGRGFKVLPAMLAADVAAHGPDRTPATIRLTIP
jgi:hypothetical protein